jgi:hypothetical protein
MPSEPSRPSTSTSKNTRWVGGAAAGLGVVAILGLGLGLGLRGRRADERALVARAEPLASAAEAGVIDARSVDARVDARLASAPDAGPSDVTADAAFVPPVRAHAKPFRARPARAAPLPPEEQKRLLDARSLVASGKAADAVAIYRELSPDGASVGAELGYALLRSGDTEWAIGVLQSYESDDDALLAQARFNLGMALDKAGDRPRAKIAYAMSYALNPTSAAHRALERADSCEEVLFPEIELERTDFDDFLAAYRSRHPESEVYPKVESAAEAKKNLCKHLSAAISCQKCDVESEERLGDPSCRAEGAWIDGQERAVFVEGAGGKAAVLSSDLILQTTTLPRANGGPHARNPTDEELVADLVVAAWSTPGFEKVEGNPDDPMSQMMGLESLTETTAIVDVARATIPVMFVRTFRADARHELKPVGGAGCPGPAL